MILKTTLLSKSLLREVPVSVILPNDILHGETPENYPVLYLLCGLMGNNESWLHGSDIAKLAETYQIAVIMPDGENGFYTDRPATREMYDTFIGEELPALMQKTFHLTHDRDKTFIAGYSMGGYGALKLSMKYEKFGYAAALSPAILTDRDYTSNEEPMYILNKNFAETIYGDLDKAKAHQSPASLIYTAKTAKSLPKLYITCGKQDKLYNVSQKYAGAFPMFGIDVTSDFTMDEGHTWYFWNQQLYKIFEWLPVEKTDAIGFWNADI